MKIVLFFRTKSKVINVDPKKTVKQLKELAANLFEFDVSEIELLFEGTPISNYFPDDTKLSDHANAGGIFSESPLIQIKVKNSEKEIERMNELLEKQKVDLFELRQAELYLRARMMLNSKQMTRMHNILLMISKNFAKQKVFNIETLVEELKTKCEKMNHKIRDLKGSIRSFIMRILHELDKHVPREGLFRNEINKIRNDADYAFELSTNIKMMKEKEDYEGAKKAKAVLLKIAGRHNKKIVDRICSFLKRTVKYQKTINPSKIKEDLRGLKEMGQEKRVLREQQKQIMLEFVKFLIKYQMMRNMTVEDCSGRRKKKKR